jgi:hypothetical protein
VSTNVTVAGIAIAVIAELWNAISPMVASCEPASNETVARLAQLENAPKSINVTVAGIAIAVIVEPRNAASPMVVSCEPASNTTIAIVAQFS